MEDRLCGDASDVDCWLLNMDSSCRIPDTFGVYVPVCFWGMTIRTVSPFGSGSSWLTLSDSALREVLEAMARMSQQRG